MIIEFILDGLVIVFGFELIWNCSFLACSGFFVDNFIVISGLFFEGSGFIICGEVGIIVEMFCGFIFFLNGLDVVFFYIIDGGFCVDVIISGVDVGMGVFILDGLFFDFVIECVGVGGSGSVFGINFELFGIYYIIVVNGMGCMEFDFFIMEVECNL